MALVQAEDWVPATAPEGKAAAVDNRHLGVTKSQGTRNPCMVNIDIKVFVKIQFDEVEIKGRKLKPTHVQNARRYKRPRAVDGYGDYWPKSTPRIAGGAQPTSCLSPLRCNTTRPPAVTQAGHPTALVPEKSPVYLGKTHRLYLGASGHMSPWR